MVETITAAASPALDHIIERPRLIARLAEGGGARVSVLSAPAGYGKTTLARQWSKRQAGPVAWYSLNLYSRSRGSFGGTPVFLYSTIAPEVSLQPPKASLIAFLKPCP